MPRNERLRQQRTARNWRQQDVADQLDISTVTVQRWERGKQQPSAYYRIKLCSLFGASAQELGLVDTISSESEAPEVEPPEPEQPEVAPIEEHTLWTVPYARNPHFTGRDDLLDQLMQQLAPTESDQLTTIRQTALTQAQAIKGLGGIGKTQIAVEYAYRAHELGYYTHTLWIAAASEEAILTSFIALADLLPAFPSQGETDQRTQVAAIIRWLEQCKQTWLLIVDNADDLSLIQPYLPRWGNGCILLTTRAHAVGSLASFLDVDIMSVIEGTHLLLRRAHRLATATDKEINEAGNLVVALGQFPLALDQAGAYIEETGCNVSDYLQLYQTHRYALLARRGKQATGYPESVATTWSLSFQHIEQANPAAAELLRLCAFLAPGHIPEELFSQGAPFWPPLLQQAVTDRFTFNQLIELLLAFSLIKRQPEEQLLSLHRLVQVVQMERIQQEEQRQWATRLVRALNAVFPRDPADPVASWTQCQRCLEQVQACDTLIQEHQLLLPEAAEMLDRVGTYLRKRALYSLAEPLYQRALHIGEQLLGLEHPQVASSLDGLALLYSQQGQYAKAEPLYRRALNIRERHLGSEHVEIATSLNNLAFFYNEQGHYGQAEPLLWRALDILERQLGPEHVEVATSLNNLAYLYSLQGQYAQAEPLLLRELGILERQLGPEHSEVAYALTGLAYLYYQQEKDTQAEPLYQQALLIWEQQLGAEHPQVAYVLHGLALLYTRQGKYEQARLLYQRALHIREQVLGPDHRETAAILHDFAGFQLAQNHTSEAVRLYQRALTIRKNVLGADHLTTIDTRERLHAALNQTEEAAVMKTKSPARGKER